MGRTLDAQVASGLDSTESTTAFPSDSTTDQLFADSTYQRWRMNNHNRGAQLVAAWPCTSAGCMVYADTNTVNANVWPEKALAHPGTVGNLLQTVTSNTPGWTSYTVPTSVCGHYFSIVSDGTNFTCTPTIFPRIVQLASDTSASGSTSFSDVTGMSFDLASGKTYTFFCDIFYQVSTTTGAPGLNLTFSGPTGTVIFGGYLAKSLAAPLNGTSTAFGTGMNTGAAGVTSVLPGHIAGTVTATAAGTLQLRYANVVTGTATVVVKQGASCQLF